MIMYLQYSGMCEILDLFSSLLFTFVLKAEPLLLLSLPGYAYDCKAVML